MFSILEMFTIGVGPSSSHTVGPMVAASRFAASLERDGILNRVGRVRTVLYGSLALTGLGHGTDRATVAGLEGNVPKTVDTDHMSNIRMECEAGGELMLNGTYYFACAAGVEGYAHTELSLPSRLRSGLVNVTVKTNPFTFYFADKASQENTSLIIWAYSSDEYSTSGLMGYWSWYNSILMVKENEGN